MHLLRLYMPLLCLALLGTATPAFATVVPVTPESEALRNADEQPQIDAADIKQRWKSMDRAERRATRKIAKAQLKEARRSGNAEEVDRALLIILAIFIPPLAMLLYDGVTARFWISLLLTLLFFLPGMIYTLVVILGET